MKTTALIFDMDGTMIDSMGYHKQSWVAFASRHGIDVEVNDLMRRTTGRTAAECMNELFQTELSAERSLALSLEKETLYRELFAPVFREVAGFCEFASRTRAMGLKVGVGTAGDKHNIAFAFSHLTQLAAPHAVVAGKPEPAIFLEAARRMGVEPAECIVFEDAPFGIEAARRAGMRAVALCTSHSAGELKGPHVLASVHDYHELMNHQFLEKLHAHA
jgi:beta-phosphoglucomutase-like phosphatase (HAD superfamily)